MARYSKLLLPLFGAALLFAQSTGATGSIRGTVSAQNGSPIPGASVLYSRIPQFQPVRDTNGRMRTPRVAPGESRINSMTTTDAGGSFFITGLPAGRYRFCVDFPASGFLNPCDAGTPLVVILSDNQAFTGGVISLIKGAVITIRVNDPLLLLPATEDAISAPHVVVGVQSNTGAFHAAAMMSRDASGRTFATAVPYAIPLRVLAFSRVARIVDQTGLALTEIGGIPLQVASGTANQTITLTVASKFRPPAPPPILAPR